MVATLGGGVDVYPAGVAKANHTRGFVERFTCGVVARAPDKPETCPAQHLIDMAVSARYHHAQKRRREALVRDVVRGDMSADMMHRHQRFSRGKAQPLGEVYTDKQCANQPGRVGYRNTVNSIERGASLLQRTVHHRDNPLDMPARGNLRHNAAIELMLVYL
jgi:hypothetical protein